MPRMELLRREDEAPPEIEKEPVSIPSRPLSSSTSPSINPGHFDLHPSQPSPPWFWDNLSRLPLCPRALVEFQRRTVPASTPRPPETFLLDKQNYAQLKLFARWGGPTLDNVRGYIDYKVADKPIASMQPGLVPPPTEGKPKLISPYDPAFRQHLIDHKIYPDGRNYDQTLYPSNLEEIKQVLRENLRENESAFTDEDFATFRKNNTDASTEAAVLAEVFPFIISSASIPHGRDILFNNLAKLTDGSLTQAKPDFYDGANPTALDMSVRRKLGMYIIPSTDTSRPCLPNFIAQAKGPDGRIAVAMNQVKHAGALSARGILQLRMHNDPKTAYDNKAYTLTTIYHGGIHHGHLTMYACHSIQPEDSVSEAAYYHTEIGYWNITGSPDAFRQGVTALRNGREWAEKQRDELIAAANEVARSGERSGLIPPLERSQAQSAVEDTQMKEEVTALEKAIATVPHGRITRSSRKQRQTSRSSTAGTTQFERLSYARVRKSGRTKTRTRPAKCHRGC